MTENITENSEVSTTDLKSMISNAIRYHKKINPEITENTPYQLSLKFMIDDKNIVVIDELNISLIPSEQSSTVVEESLTNEIVETPIEEKYAEYDSFMKEMNRDTKSTLKNQFRDIHRSIVKATGSKVPM